MLFEKLTIQTDLSSEQIQEKLNSAVALETGRLSLSDAKKPFHGSLNGSKFRLRVQAEPGQTLRIRRGLVQIVGNVEGSKLNVTLRHPLFNMIFTLAYSLFIGWVFVLTLKGQATDFPVRPLLVGMFCVPLIPQALFFRSEAAIARRKLSELFGHPL